MMLSWFDTDLRQLKAAIRVSTYKQGNLIQAVKYNFKNGRNAVPFQPVIHNTPVNPAAAYLCRL